MGRPDQVDFDASALFYGGVRLKLPVTPAQRLTGGTPARATETVALPGPTNRVRMIQVIDVFGEAPNTAREGACAPRAGN